MATAEDRVYVDIQAQDNLSAPFKKSEKALAGLDTQAGKSERSLQELGQQAVKTADQVLSIEKARAAFEVANKVFDAVAESFKAMAENSAKMAGEMDAISVAGNKVVGALGDAIAQGAAFKTVVDTLEDGMSTMQKAIEDNADTINRVFAEAVRGILPVVKVVILEVQGLLNLVLLAREMVPAAKKEAEGFVESGLHGWEALFHAITGNKEAAQEAGDASVRAAGETSGLIVDAAGRAEFQISKLNGALGEINKEIDKLDAKLAAGGTSTRANRVKGGGGRAAGLSAEELAEDRRLAKAAAADRFVPWQEPTVDAPDFLAAPEDSGTAKVGEGLEDMAEKATVAGNTMSMAFAGIEASLGSLVQTMIDGKTPFSQAMQQMAAAVLTSIAQQSAIKALYETAEAVAALARYDYAAAGEHFAAAGLYGAIGVGAGAAAYGMGKLSGGGDRESRGAAGGGAGWSASNPLPVRIVENDAPMVVTTTQFLGNGYRGQGTQAGAEMARALRQARAAGRA